MTDKLCEIGYIRKEYYGQIAMTDSGVKAANSFFTSYILPFPNGESLTDFKKRCVAAFDKAVQKYKDKNAISLNDINVDILQKMMYYLYVTSENLCCLCTEPSVVILPRIFLETKVLLQKNPYKLKAQFKVNINPLVFGGS